MAPQVHRDRAWVQREYGTEKWPQVRKIVDSVIASEPDMPLARAVSAVHHAEMSGQGRGALGEPVHAVFGGEQVEVPQPLVFGAFQQLCSDVVRELCSERTDAVIELGSGWGRNLFCAWLAGAAPGAQYVAAELMEAGRDAAARLAALEPRLRLRTLEFDYYSPDLSALGPLNDAVVFTSHSIEQIPQLPAALIETLSGIAPRVRVAHFEPVGWQLDGDGHASSRGFAEQHDYNRDLVAVLEDAEREGRLRIERTMVNVVGTRADNASTLIVWSAGA